MIFQRGRTGEPESSTDLRGRVWPAAAAASPAWPRRSRSSPQRICGSASVLPMLLTPYFPSQRLVCVCVCVCVCASARVPVCFFCGHPLSLSKETYDLQLTCHSEVQQGKGTWAQHRSWVRRYRRTHHQNEWVPLVWLQTNYRVSSKRHIHTDENAGTIQQWSVVLRVLRQVELPWDEGTLENARFSMVTSPKQENGHRHNLAEDLPLQKCGSEPIVFQGRSMSFLPTTLWRC